MKKTKILVDAGINWHSDMNELIQLATVVKSAQCDGFKIQKREPRISVPKHMWDVPKETPWWGTIPYIEYKERLEPSLEQCQQLDTHCKNLGLSWSTSVWDVESLELMVNNFKLPWIKIPSAHSTNKKLVQECAKWARENDKQVIVSVGMTNLKEMDECHRTIQDILKNKTNDLLAILWCHSSYPAPVSEINLSCIPFLKERYKCVVGYSSHETTIITKCAAIYLGAEVLECHVTLDRDAGGTDDWASVTTWGLHKWVDGVRQLEKAYGDGIPKVYDSELPNRKKLRGV